MGLARRDDGFALNNPLVVPFREEALPVFVDDLVLDFLGDLGEFCAFDWCVYITKAADQAVVGRKRVVSTD